MLLGHLEAATFRRVNRVDAGLERFLESVVALQSPFAGALHRTGVEGRRRVLEVCADGADFGTFRSRHTSFVICNPNGLLP